MGTLLQFPRKPRSLAEIACAKQLARTTAQLRAELDPLTRAWLREFVAEMSRQEAFNDVMLSFAGDA